MGESPFVGVIDINDAIGDFGNAVGCVGEQEGVQMIEVLPGAVIGVYQQADALA